MPSEQYALTDLSFMTSNTITTERYIAWEPKCWAPNVFIWRVWMPCW